MKRKIVLCEAELIVSLDLKMALIKNGFEVSGYFLSAEEALKFIKSTKPDLVITNVKLKGKINGFEFSKILVEKYSIKVVLITGEMDEKALLISKSVCQVKKPFTAQEIVSKITILLNE
ncbi:MAG: response regulator [Ignavibacteriaceae bacterium]